MNVVQNNLISIVVLLILFLGIFKQVNHKDLIYRSFLALLGMNGIMLTIQMVVFLINGIDGQVVYITMASLSIIYHLLIPIILFFTFMFVEFHFYAKPYKPWRYVIPFGLMFISNSVFVFMSLSQDYIFTIGSDNVYHLGSWYLLYELSIYLVFVGIFVYTVINRKKVARSTFVPLSLLILPLTVTMILTAFASFVYVTWNALMISLLIMYIFMQLQITSTDYLTGLQNRRGYEYLLFNLNKSKIHNETITGIMIDIDNFKNINDVYGHAVGDEALKVFGEILKRAVRKNDFVSRTGGDEFAIIIQSNEPDVDKIVVQRIQRQLDEYNKEMPLGFTLSVSMGSDIYSESKYQTITDFFEYLDKEMYRNKRENEKIHA